jgi:hypothetical protein
MPIPTHPHDRAAISYGMLGVFGGIPRCQEVPPGSTELAMFGSPNRGYSAGRASLERIRRRWALKSTVGRTCAFVASMGLATCTSSNRATSGSGSTMLEASARTIGASGGTVTSSDGALTLTVPAGALSNSVPITINVAASAPSGFLGKAYDIGPTGTQFLRPVGLAFQYDAAFGDPGALSIATVNGSGAWVPLPLSVADMTSVRAMTTHLSYYGVYGQTTACKETPDCEGPFQCVGGKCAIPCRTTSDCPPPFGCNSDLCEPQSCSTDLDCTKGNVAGWIDPGTSTVCGIGGICLNDSNPVATNSSSPSPCPPPVEGPPMQTLGCPGVQFASCYICGIFECPYYSNGFPVGNCLLPGACAYGSCWPISTGCPCGTSGCDCGEADGGGPSIHGEVQGADAALDEASSPDGGACSANIDVTHGGVCNSLAANMAQAITPACSATPAGSGPYGVFAEGAGGTIADGMYVLTADTYYSDDVCELPDFSSEWGLIVVAGNCWQSAHGYTHEAGTSWSNSSSTVSIGGIIPGAAQDTQLTSTPTCPSYQPANQGSQGFTAVGGTLSLFLFNDVQVYTKQ